MLLGHVCVFIKVMKSSLIRISFGAVQGLKEVADVLEFDGKNNRLAIDGISGDSRPNKS